MRMARFDSVTALPMGDRHHYVPQFYLRNFSVGGEVGFLWMYRRQQSPLKVPVKSVAFIANFYQAQLIENLYGKIIETPTAPILKRIIEIDQLDLSNEERVTIAKFVSHLITRNPKFRHIEEEVYKFAKNREQGTAGPLSNKEETIKQWGAEIREDFHDFFEGITHERVESLISETIADPEIPRLLEEVSDDDLFSAFATIFPFGTASKFAQTLLDSEWRLIESGSSIFFVTSDNPVSSIPPIDKPMDWEGGFLNQCICLPLSPKKCLALSGGTGFGPTVRVNREAVERVNRYTMFFANDFVYSNRNSRDFEDAFNKTVKGESDEIILKNLSRDDLL